MAQAVSCQCKCVAKEEAESPGEPQEWEQLVLCPCLPPTRTPAIYSITLIPSGGGCLGSWDRGGGEGGDSGE